MYNLKKPCPSGPDVRDKQECEQACTNLGIPLSENPFIDGRSCYKDKKGGCEQNGKFGKKDAMVCKVYEPLIGANYTFRSTCSPGAEILHKRQCIKACTDLKLPLSRKRFKAGRPCYKNKRGVCNQNGHSGPKSSMICQSEGT